MILTQSLAKKCVQDLMSTAGIEFDGRLPSDPQIHDERFYARVLRDKNLGLGESYVEGLWDCDSIDEFICRILKMKIADKVGDSTKYVGHYLMHLLLNCQTKTKSKKVAEQHYDLGNDLYEKMLDKEMIYSCGYWQGAKTLDEAQINKLELACQKLQLEPGMRLLDIGCGWGGMAKYAAQKYGVEVVGVTISKEQKKIADERCAGLPIEIRLQDYRDISEKFDRIVSIGMFEHVGRKNYVPYMKVAGRCLKEDGIFLLHTIGSNVSYVGGDPWICKYIFPHGMLPSIAQIGKAIENVFVMEDWHNFGPDYDRTLMAWHDNFNKNWPQLEEKYGPHFKRMWDYYLLSCAGGFRSRTLQLWQIVLSKNGLKNGFRNRELRAS